MTMKNELLLIQQRNKLIVHILSLFYLLMTIVYFGFDPTFSSIWPPVGLVVCAVLYVVVYFFNKPLFAMYVVVTGIFAYLFYLNLEYPYLVNYIFIFFGVILISLYQSFYVIIYGGIVSTFILSYLFFTKYDQIFFSIEPFDLIYFILFSLLMVIFFLFHTRFTKDLWNKAVKNEERTNRKLKSTEAYLTSLYEQTNEAIILFDLTGKVETVNPSFERLYGMKKEEIVGKFLPIFTFEGPRFLKEIIHKVENGERIEQYEMIDIGKGRGLIHIEMSVFSIIGPDQEMIAVSAVIRDITEKKKTEEQLMHSEKLSVVGQLAAGIAHEIRNPLTVVSGFTQLIEQGKSKKHYGSIMKEEISRINQIVSELLVLSKPHTSKKEKCELSKIVNEVFLLFESQLFLYKINVKLMNDTKDTNVLCDRNQIKQVIINCLKNAMESIESEGLIELVISDQTDKFITLTIEDNGEGIPADVLAKLGTPFFTTKETGTGLGVMICERIISQHEGMFEITSEVGVGTKVEIYLPSVE
ncbi:ATP-binding protein [Bacillus sp. FJAT-45350]|uniref:ATP-binding protein n=1 Tax=Bacillus sp. FJAT-45350 TaxID=2011014 RepID=UPI000BB80CC9|nr:ATP-binding protein [Bacillus sp. FJAT-45350]